MEDYYTYITSEEICPLKALYNRTKDNIDLRFPVVPIKPLSHLSLTPYCTLCLHINESYTVDICTEITINHSKPIT